MIITDIWKNKTCSKPPPSLVLKSRLFLNASQPLNIYSDHRDRDSINNSDPTGDHLLLSCLKFGNPIPSHGSSSLSLGPSVVHFQGSFSMIDMEHSHYSIHILDATWSCCPYWILITCHGPFRKLGGPGSQPVSGEINHFWETCVRFCAYEPSHPQRICTWWNKQTCENYKVYGYITDIQIYSRTIDQGMS